MPPVGFEPTISAGERPQTYALDRAATGTGNRKDLDLEFVLILGEVKEDFVSAFHVSGRSYFDMPAIHTG